MKVDIRVVAPYRSDALIQCSPDLRHSSVYVLIRLLSGVTSSEKHIKNNDVGRNAPLSIVCDSVYIEKTNEE